MVPRGCHPPDGHGEGVRGGRVGWVPGGVVWWLWGRRAQISHSPRSLAESYAVAESVTPRVKPLNASTPVPFLPLPLFSLSSLLAELFEGPPACCAAERLAGASRASVSLL